MITVAHFCGDGGGIWRSATLPTPRRARGGARGDAVPFWRASAAPWTPPNSIGHRRLRRRRRRRSQSARASPDSNHLQSDAHR